jgi:hypothetical protein
MIGSIVLLIIYKDEVTTNETMFFPWENEAKRKFVSVTGNTNHHRSRCNNSHRLRVKVCNTFRLNFLLHSGENETVSMVDVFIVVSLLIENTRFWKIQ